MAYDTATNSKPSDRPARAVNAFTLIWVWTVVVAVLAGVGVYRERTGIMESARIEARAHFNQVKNIRHWVASLGGVYVPISEATPPNPDLEGRVAERDITTPGGKKLTLVNPAYVTRLLAGGLSQSYEVSGRLVSYDPLRLGNTADPWETDALKAFAEHRETERIEIGAINGEQHMRYIAPLFIEEPCLACHADKGDIGDLRGGISVAIPMRAHDEIARAHMLTIGLEHGAIWLFGVAGIFLFSGRLNRTITTLKTREKTLAEAQSIAHIGSWSLDLATNKLEWSDEIYRIFGQDPETFESTYESFLNTIHPHDRDMVSEAYSTSVETRGSYDVVHRIVRKTDGAVRYVHERGHHERNEFGNVVRSIGTVQDITEHKHSEDQIVSAKNAAERANAAKSEFLANMSHDVRTPLNAIIGFAQMMEQKVHGSLGSSHYDEYVRAINHSGQYLVSLINDILDLSKIESGRYVLDDQVQDLLAIINVAVEMAQPQILQRNQTLTVTAPSSLPLVKCEKRAMLQVMSNLLSNTMQHTPKGHEVIIAVTLDETGAVTVSVSADEMELSASDKEKLFQPFGQGDAMIASDNAPGSGLGLHLSRRLMELQDGEINVHATPGKGSRVSARLPAERVQGR
ncbi:histidine kinase dimerization/phospho-acceptor domain-containing protein [Pseudomonadota bacterium]